MLKVIQSCREDNIHKAAKSSINCFAKNNKSWKEHFCEEIAKELKQLWTRYQKLLMKKFTSATMNTFKENINAYASSTNASGTTLQTSNANLISVDLSCLDWADDIVVQRLVNEFGLHLHRELPDLRYILDKQSTENCPKVSKGGRWCALRRDTRLSQITTSLRIEEAKPVVLSKTFHGGKKTSDLRAELSWHLTCRWGK